MQTTSIKALAERVGIEDADYTEAITMERRARTNILKEVIRVIRPGLRAICSRVAISSTMSGAGTTTDPAPWRGLKLFGTGVLRLRQGEPSGTFSGHDLFLSDDGQLHELAYRGTWSKEKGAVSKWEAKITTLTNLGVAEEYDLDPILSSVEAALRAQLQGGKAENADALRATTRRLEDVGRLLRELP